MDASQFTMWLQGFAELSAEPPTREQWQSIREHLQLVFSKITPPVQAPKAPDKAGPVVDSEAMRRWFEKNKKESPKVFPDYQMPAMPQPQPYWLQPGGAGVITC